MLLSVAVTPEAEQDIAEAYLWYETQRIGLGEDFLDRLDACFNFMARNPEAYPSFYKSYHRALLRRFPYAVFYECNETQVVVWGIFHTSRNANKWRQRLP